MSVQKNFKKQLADDEYVVARIAGMKIVHNIRYFLIEWEGYELKDNTWEEQKNILSKSPIRSFLEAYKKEASLKENVSLANISDKILLSNTYDPDTGLYYNPKIKLTSSTTNQSNRGPKSVKLIRNVNAIVSISQNSDKKPSKRYRSIIETESNERTLKTKKEDKEIVKHFQFKKIETPDGFVNNLKKSVKNQFPIIDISDKFQSRLPLYQIQNLDPEVTILNEIDSELPNDFLYIDELKYSDSVPPPDPDFLSGCVCSRSADCRYGCHDTSSYNEYGRLIINQGTAIYECNRACECGSKCKNRVVQSGRKVPLQIFKTRSKGWGVRSKKYIPKGTYVEQYIGEVITVEEGDARGIYYDKLGCSYLFDMDFAQSELPTKYVIDSHVLGNVSRFFNHSCSPNLEVYAVFYDSADNQMHRLAFFAKRDIEVGEELCFDYNGRRDNLGYQDVEGASRYLCRCNSVDCRKWIYL